MGGLLPEPARSTLVAAQPPPKMSSRRIHTTEDSGQTMTEYAVLLAFIFLIVVFLLPQLASAVAQVFSNISAGL